MSLTGIQERVRMAAKKSGRDPSSVTLIAASKVQPNERVHSVLEAGHRVFGENRVQEAAGKWPNFRKEYSCIDLHLLGPLQTNKLTQALELFDSIHSLDRDKLANKLANAIQTRGDCPKLFIQVNTGEELQKAGVLPADIDTFVKTCRETLDLPIQGLMCIPPIDADPSVHFTLLHEMAERNGLKGLSMGMSADFECAIALGATHVRVGSAIFGERVA